MAGETTQASAVDSQFPKWFNSAVKQEIRPLNIPRELCAIEGVKNSSTFRWTFLSDPGPATAKSEGVSMTNTQLGTSGADVSAGTVGQMATITREASAVSLFDMYSQYGAQLVRSVAEKFSTDYAGAIDDFTNDTSTTGVDLVMSQIIVASTALRGRDATGTLAGVLHTQQIGDLQQDMATSLATVNTGVPSMIGNVDASTLGGYQGTWYGIPFYMSSLINTANSAADRRGAIFVVNESIGLYEIWGPTTQTFEDIELPGTEIAVTQRYGFGVIRDAYGQTVTSDA